MHTYVHAYVHAYCIVQVFSGGKPWSIWGITSGLPNFTITMSRDIYKENRQAGICLSFTPPKIHAIWYITYVRVRLHTHGMYNTYII